jgi:hypothetical protein
VLRPVSNQIKKGFPMKALFWIGIVLVVLGVLSLFVPIPQTDRQGISAGGVSLNVQTQTSERVSPIVSCVLVMAGAGMIVAGRGAAKA